MNAAQKHFLKILGPKGDERLKALGLEILSGETSREREEEIRQELLQFKERREQELVEVDAELARRGIVP